MSPTYEVEIWDAYGKAKKVRLLALMAWAVGLKAEVKGIQVSSTEIAPIVREFLGVTDDYPIEDLSQYITESYEDIKAQLAEYNEQMEEV